MRITIRSITLLAVLSLLGALVAPAMAPPKKGKPIKVAWSPSRVENSHVVDDTILVELTPDGTGEGATLGMSASLQGFIGLPDGPFDLEQGVPVPIELTILQTPDEAGRTLGGTIHVFLDGKHLAKPLSISLKKTESDDEEEEPREEDEPEDDDDGDGRGRVIAWMNGEDPLDAVTLELFEDGAGQIALLPSRDLTNVYLWLTPSLRNCLMAEVSLDNVNEPEVLEIAENGDILFAAAGTPVLIDLFLPETDDDSSQTCGGTIHVRNVGRPPRTWPAPLNVRLGAEEEEGEEVAPAIAVGAASFEARPIAPGQIATIFGQGLGPNENALFDIDDDGAIGEHAAGTMVFFDGVPARVLSVRNDQVNIIVPQELEGEEVELLVVRSGFQSTPFPVPMRPYAPELFTLTGEGRGQIAAFNEDGSLNRASNPAPQGSTVIGFGTGVGPTEDPLGDGEIAKEASEITALVEIWVGGVQAIVHYAGTSPGQVGALTQFNFEPGAGTPSGQQEVKLIVNGVESTQKATVAVE